MQFSDSDETLSPVQLEQIEEDLQLEFPEPFKRLYLESNGGSPSPYVFTNEDIDTVVSELLPLTSRSSGTAVRSYKHLVLDSKLVPRRLFPFAIDGGGDYFFVDCSSPTGTVYFYRSESSEGDRLVDLGLGFEEFWESLTGEN
jgi:SMI1 / KNR4 family (SUKH-1)